MQSRRPLPIASFRDRILNTNNLQQTIRDAMILMRSGDLTAATTAIQRGLEQPHPTYRPTPERPTASEGSLDGEFHVATDATESIVLDHYDAEPGTPVTRSLQAETFNCAEGTRDYLVYAPGEPGLERPPLILMLHGCTQSAADFARGTRMHQRAAAEGYVVVYPTQSRSGNPGGCWNWFRPGDQQRDSGEPAILAGLVLEMSQRFNCDPNRIYVAGLSAGGAMAIALARAYPDVFRAVGVHSGLAYGAAHDMPSAMMAMRNGAAGKPRHANAEGKAEFVPTIVFHGDRDQTVDVANARRVAEDAAEAWANSLGPDSQIRSDSSRTQTATGGREYTATCIRDLSGKSRVETWIVHGAGHAWFGGDAAGTYTDPAGPDATAEMLRFFRDAG